MMSFEAHVTIGFYKIILLLGGSSDTSLLPSSYHQKQQNWCTELPDQISIEKYCLSRARWYRVVIIVWKRSTFKSVRQRHIIWSDDITDPTVRLVIDDQWQANVHADTAKDETTVFRNEIRRTHVQIYEVMSTTDGACVVPYLQVNIIYTSRYRPQLFHSRKIWCRCIRGVLLFVNVRIVDRR